MDNWFDVIAASRELEVGTLRELERVGFIVTPGPFSSDGLASLAEAYDSATASASAEDVRSGGRLCRCSTLAPAYRNDTMQLYR